MLHTHVIRITNGALNCLYSLIQHVHDSHFPYISRISFPLYIKKSKNCDLLIHNKIHIYVVIAYIKR